MFTPNEEDQLAKAANHEAALGYAMGRYHNAVESGPDYDGMLSALADASWHCQCMIRARRRLSALLNDRRQKC